MGCSADSDGGGGSSGSTAVCTAVGCGDGASVAGGVDVGGAVVG